MVKSFVVSGVQSILLPLSALQVEQLGCSFNPAAYTTLVAWATSKDGTQVPITLAYKCDLMKQDGTNPCLLHG